ncbi:TetR/AcrR family transcriptional regulator [Kiloniella laminariae]|uniref:TetR/AcrR family transcriptional regulator n=1 Tax=Kiloniella laminariae TaxID=454162 RepID=A0ABT4LMB1_9PROT|nr:TetR/AcrR family transcriptional regulator [Kiloniella laminariae]MCZ4282227.1 TetR/AcrR family transcriptional regulator [Kiloniella laminariae]
MGRPSKKAERTEQILAAFQRCVARSGLEGSTLDQIAEEAGMQRSLVRHFAGNREELVRTLAHWVIGNSVPVWEEFKAGIPEDNPLDYLLDGLFEEKNTNPETVLVISALTFSAGNDPDLAKMLRNWINSFTQDIQTILGSIFPQAKREQVDAVAFGLVSLNFNLDALSPLNIGPEYRRAARTCAESLISTLRNASE